jgi:hypothetical protein
LAATISTFAGFSFSMRLHLRARIPVAIATVGTAPAAFKATSFATVTVVGRSVGSLVVTGCAATTATSDSYNSTISPFDATGTTTGTRAGGATSRGTFAANNDLQLFTSGDSEAAGGDAAVASLCFIVAVATQATTRAVELSGHGPIGRSLGE